MTDSSLVHRTSPASAGEPPHPALILLHGRGADENDLMPLADHLDPRLFVITARAPFAFPWGGYVWYDLTDQGVGHPDIRTLSVSVEKVSALIDEAIGAYSLDPRRIYVGGFSNGAATSAVLALLQPEKVAGAAILSGYFPPHVDLPLRPEDAAGHPIFEAHGTLDPVIPVAWARAGRDALADMPVELTYREYPMGHEISFEELQDLSAWLTGILDKNTPTK